MSRDLYNPPKIVDHGIHAKAFDSRSPNRSPVRKFQEKLHQIKFSPTRTQLQKSIKTVEHHTNFDTRWQNPDPLKIR